MDRDVNSITEESEEIEITDRQAVDNVEISVWPQQAGTVQWVYNVRRTIQWIYR
jgi:hypothetical protein